MPVSSTVKTQLILLILSHILCWLPSSTIFLSLLFIGRHSITLLLWTAVIILPLNSVANPVVFAVFALLQRKKHQHPWWETFQVPFFVASFYIAVYFNFNPRKCFLFLTSLVNCTAKNVFLTHFCFFIKIALYTVFFWKNCSTVDVPYCGRRFQYIFHFGENIKMELSDWLKKTQLFRETENSLMPCDVIFFQIKIWITTNFQISAIFISFEL